MKQEENCKMDDYVILARNLTKKYGKVVAVDGLSLKVRRGEIFGLVGPDGAGKTTTIQMLCAILDPTSGEATVAGFDTVKESAAIGNKIGYMSEGFSLYNSLTVDENIEFSADLYKVPEEMRKERKKKLLHFSRLTPFINRRVEQLSGGMKKKLALCCTLIHSPKILFLDEPTTGVDPVSRRDFWMILYDFLKEGITIFVSTPYMDEAERFHRVALMYGGKIIREDTPAGLKEGMKGEILDIKASPQQEAVEILKRSERVTRVQVFGERLHILVEKAAEEIPLLGSTLSDRGVALEDIRRSSPTLEDVFISSVREVERTEASSSWTTEGIGHSRTLKDKEKEGADGLAITVFHLTKKFDSFTAVDDVSFAVEKGEVFGFLGPNGAGKTTVIRMLCGLLLPTAGTATVAGNDIISAHHKIKPQIGYMSQKFSLYKDLTVEENIDFYAGVYEVPKKKRPERKKWVLEMAGLKGKEGSLTKDLSGGWRQRLALGCAILHEPPVLFLDEPTSGVDPISRRYFWDLIYHLSTQGVTVFVTTHYMDEAEHCNSLGLIYQGKLIALGSPEKLRKEKLVGDLLEVECSEPIRAFEYLSGQPFSSQVALFGSKLHILVEEAAEAASLIQVALQKENITVSRIEQAPLALEDLFISLIEAENRKNYVHSSGVTAGKRMG